MLDCYLLSDLQNYLQQYPASHYSHNGKEPLLYVVVLLLSLQFRWVLMHYAGAPGEGDGARGEVCCSRAYWVLAGRPPPH